MFTARYLKVPIELYDVKYKDVTNREVPMASWYKFLPFELSAFRPTFSLDRPELIFTTITLKNGDSTMVTMPPEDFEKLLNDFMKE